RRRLASAEHYAVDDDPGADDERDAPERGARRDARAQDPRELDRIGPQRQHEARVVARLRREVGRTGAGVGAAEPLDAARADPARRERDRRDAAPAEQDEGGLHAAPSTVTCASSSWKRAGSNSQTSSCSALAAPAAAPARSASSSGPPRSRTSAKAPVSA